MRPTARPPHPHQPGLSASYHGPSARAARLQPPAPGAPRIARRANTVAWSLILVGHLASVRRGGKHKRWRRGRLRRHPAAGLLGMVLLLTMLFSLVAPLVPLVRLGYDATDALRRAAALQALLADGPSTLLNAGKIDDAQRQVSALRVDLYELNGAANLLLAPVGVFSAQAQDMRLLIRIGTELTTVADEGLQVARLILTPLEGGALGPTTDVPSITSADLRRAGTLLADADGHLGVALEAASRLNPTALPRQLRAGTRYGGLLARLPEAKLALGQLALTLRAAPQLLGIGQPAYYLVIAMDRSELRPAGGLMGNYGILELDGGKQSSQRPLSLRNTYNLDSAYYRNPALNSHPDLNDKPACYSSGPQPPERYWWWPIRRFSCEYGWGLRDSGLSPDFPTNARMALQIAKEASAVPAGVPIQGVIAFTPVLIERVLDLTGPLSVPVFNVTVTGQTLERQIHDYQLLGKTPPGQDRKEFTHQLSIALLARLRSLRGAALKPLLKLVQDALREKELELYFSDAQMEGLLGQLGVSAAAQTNGDGFFVVDTNDGGNKANLYVTERQTDVVTLLPNGGALHRLQVAVTYAKTGRVYEGATGFEDYSDVQRTYLPGDARILDYAGFTPPVFAPTTCGHGGYASPITACDSAHALTLPSTTSDTPGRAMVMGPVLVTCGGVTNFSTYDPTAELATCRAHPGPQTLNIYLTWYTPQAFTLDARGHGTYTEQVEKQPGSVDSLAVYVVTTWLRGPSASASAWLADVPHWSEDATARDAAFADLVAGARRIASGPLSADTTITYRF